MKKNQTHEGGYEFPGLTPFQKNRFTWEVIFPHCVDPERMEDVCNPISDLYYTVVMRENGEVVDISSFVKFNEKELLKTVKELYEKSK